MMGYADQDQRVTGIHMRAFGETRVENISGKERLTKTKTCFNILIDTFFYITKLVVSPSYTHEFIERNDVQYDDI